MAISKQAGLGMACAVDDVSGTPQNISTDVTQLDWNMPRAVQDVTSIDNFSMERILLLADFSINITGVFNAALSHTVFNAVANTNKTRNIQVAIGSAAGAAAIINTPPYLQCACVLTNYTLTRAAKGELTWKVPGQLNTSPTTPTTIPTWT